MALNMKLLPKYRKGTATRLEEITFRGFGGGLNTIHDDISIDARYLVDAKNVFRQASGAMRVRFGDKWRADGSSIAVGTDIIDMEYFNARLICVTNAGNIFTMDDDGDLALIWDATIASGLPGAPSGWGSTFTTVDFVPFRDRCVIHNGVDKPVRVGSDFTVEYLQDDATGSNVNVPIGKYGCTVSNYHCVAGIPALPTTIYISSSGTDGVFPGDAAPNDSLAIDVGAYAPEGTIQIRGVAGFRTSLIVFFQAQALIITLGKYNDAGVHTPEYPDTLPKFGLLGHRCIATLANDLQFADLYGVSSAKRNLFSGLYDTRHLSEYIEPTYRADVGTLTENQQLINTFMIHDPTEHSTMTFLPNGKVYTYSASEEVKYRAWTYYQDMNYTCGCTSFLGRVFLATGMKIFQKGNAVYANENYYADKIADRDGDWIIDTAYTVDYLAHDLDTDEVYRCIVNHTSSSAASFELDRDNFPLRWELYEGNPIVWYFEMPWVDGRDPMKTKQLRFGKVGSLGTAEFDLFIYVDNLYKNDLGAVIYDPALTFRMIGNSTSGFGVDVGPYGGSRASGDPRLYKIPCKFKSIKFAFGGSSIDSLVIANASFLFTKGKFKR